MIIKSFLLFILRSIFILIKYLQHYKNWNAYLNNVWMQVDIYYQLQLVDLYSFIIYYLFIYKLN